MIAVGVASFRIAPAKTFHLPEPVYWKIPVEQHSALRRIDPVVIVITNCKYVRNFTVEQLHRAIDVFPFLLATANLYKISNLNYIPDVFLFFVCNNPLSHIP